MHFSFDVKINHKLNNKSSELLFKRGFEHLTEEGITGYQQSVSCIEFDEFESNRKIKELSSLIKEKPWQLFFTATSNDNGTPGLAPVFFAFRVASQEDV